MSLAHSFGPALSYENEEVGKLACDSYTLSQLEAVRSKLASKGTLSLRRYAQSGGSSAVSVLDLGSSLESAIDGLLLMQWPRDCVFQALGELQVSLDKALGEELGIHENQWKLGLGSCLKHSFRHQHRFLDVILGNASGLDVNNGPHSRYNPVSLDELPGRWGHRQNDSLGLVSFLMYYGLNRGLLDLHDDSFIKLRFGNPAFKPAAEAFAALQHQYFWTVNVWQDFEQGAWEDTRAEHASSIAVVVMSLREQLAYIRAHGGFGWNVDGRGFHVSEHGVADMLSRCESKLWEILPNEFVRSESAGQRHADSALVNPLLLASLTGKPLLNDQMTLRIIDNITAWLMGHRGIARYPKDRWDGRTERHDLGHKQEAQWCHVDPMISYVLGEMFRRTGDARLYQRQSYHFNRALGCINKRWNLPEAYIINPLSRQWDSDLNEPLAWAKAMVIVAFAGMKASIAHRQAQESCAASSLPRAA